MHVTTHIDRAPTAMVQMGQFQITVELPAGISPGHPQWAPQMAKSIAAGLEDAYSQWPPKANA